MAPATAITRHLAALKRALTAIVIVGLLGGCGYQLQGHHARNTAVNAAHVTFKHSQQPLEQAMQTQMRQLGVSNNANAIRVSVGKLDIQSRNRSLARKDQPFERELEATLEVSFSNSINSNAPFVLQERFSHSVVYTHDPLALAASNRDERAQRQQLLSNLSRQVLLRLAQLPSPQ